MRKLSLLAMLCLLTTIAWAQDRTVSGVVSSSEDGATLPGVTVLVEGTNAGAVTDIDGNYKIKIPDDGTTLVFTYLGFVTQKIEIGTQTTVNVALQSDSKQLEEVVVTAMGIQREKKALGYSVEQVDGEKVQQISEPDAIRALQGKVAGVNISGSSSAPGAATRVVIRGNTSLSNSNTPLYVVDGVPYDASFVSTGSQLSNGAAYSNRAADIDPNNIAEISVLKGAAAAALYGSRAARGVIVITTKSGKVRQNRKGMEITLNSSYSFEEVANLPDYQNSYGGGSDFTYGNVNGSWGPAFSELDSIPHWYGPGQGGNINTDPSTTFPQFTDFNVLDPNGNPTAVNILYQAYPNNVEDFFETGTLIENSIAITSGGEKGTFSAVLSRTQNDGIIPNSELTRYNLSLGATSVLDNGVTVGGTFGYTNTLQVGPISAGNALGSTSISSRLLWLNRAWPLHDKELLPDTNPLDNSNVFPVGADNPEWLIDNSAYESKVDRFVGNMNFAYDFNDWLSASYRIGINQYTDNRNQFVAAGSVGRGGIGEIMNDQYYSQEINSDLLLTITQELNEDFDIKAIIGHNYNQRRFDNQAVFGTGIVSRDVTSINLDNTTTLANGTSSGADLGISKRRLAGVFADISVGYRDWAYLNFTARNDWSSTLPQGNNSFFYPGVSGTVILTEAVPSIQNDILNNLKFRAGYARVGNDASVYLLSPTFEINPDFGNNANGLNFPFNGIPAATLGGTFNGADILGSDELTPEFTTEVEFGLEAQLLKGKVNLELTYYDRSSTDQITPITLPSSSGFGRQITNIGELTNEGVEIGLDVTPVTLQNGFSWNIYGTFTHNHNEVVDIGENEQLITGAAFGNPSTALIEGEEYGSIIGFGFARDEEGNFLIDNSGNVIVENDTRILGNPNPDFIVGITNTLRFKGFSLSTVIDWRQGGEFYSSTVETLLARGVTKDTEDREASAVIKGYLGDANTGELILDENGEKIPNEIQTNVNRLFFEDFGFGGAAEKGIFDATVVRLREVSLRYDIPKKFLENSPIGSANISISGRNLWYHAPGFPEHTNFDPETNLFGASNSQGIEIRTYLPSTRRYGVNVSFTF